MIRLRKIMLLSGCIIAVCGFCFALDNENLEIHPFLQSETYCFNCHSQKENYKLRDTGIACAQLCLTCHKGMENHHAIDIRISESLPDAFVLTDKKRLTCITCHNIKNTRYDSASWKAESLFEKVFKGGKQYKTYYLVRKNNQGQLCKTCH